MKRISKLKEIGVDNTDEIADRLISALEEENSVLLYKLKSRKNQTKTFIGGLVVGIGAGLFIGAIFIDLMILK